DQLDHRSNAVNQLRANCYQLMAGPQLHQVLLRFLCAMLDRMQQFRIHTSHSCPIVCIDPVSFILVFVDHPHSSRIGNQNLMSQAFQESADPTGVGPRFQGDPHRFYVSEFALQGFGRRRNLSFFDHFSVAVQNHVVAFLVGQIQSHREIMTLLVILFHWSVSFLFSLFECVFAYHYRYCVKGDWPSQPYLCGLNRRRSYASSQPDRTGSRMNSSASGSPRALTFAASHSIRLPVLKESVPSRAISVRRAPYSKLLLGAGPPLQASSQSRW